MSRLRYTKASPEEIGSLGFYRLGVKTGVIAAGLAANAELFQFRWAHASRLASIRSVKISAAVSTTYFAAGVPLTLDVVKSTAWSVAGTGGTAIAPAALLKQKTTMASSSLASGDARIATTAGLGAGTKTLETLSLGVAVSGAPITASLSGQIFPPDTALFDSAMANAGWPLVLAANEGFSIRAVQTPATGVWELAVNVEWAETDAYPY